MGQKDSRHGKRLHCQLISSSFKSLPDPNIDIRYSKLTSYFLTLSYFHFAKVYMRSLCFKSIAKRYRVLMLSRSTEMCRITREWSCFARSRDSANVRDIASRIQCSLPERMVASIGCSKVQNYRWKEVSTEWFRREVSKFFGSCVLLELFGLVSISFAWYLQTRPIFVLFVWLQAVCHYERGYNAKKYLSRHFSRCCSHILHIFAPF